MTSKLKTIIEISAGDTSGIDAMTDLDRATNATAETLDLIKQTGGFGGIAVEARDLESATIRMESLASQTRVLRGEIANTVSGLNDLERGTPDFDRQTAKLAKQTEQYRKLVDEIEDIPKKLSQANDFEGRIGNTRNQVGRFGDAEQAGNQLLGVFGRLGGTEIEAIGLVGTELIATAESMPLLLESVKGIGELALSSSGRFGQLATTTVGATAGITGVNASLIAVTAVALPFVALIGAGAVAISAYNESNKGAIETTRAVIEVQKELFNLIENGTQQQIEDEAKKLKEQERGLSALVEKQQADFRTFEKEAGVFGRAFADIFNAGGSKEYRESLQENEEELRKVQTQLNLYNQAIDTAQVKSATFAQGISDVGKQYADALRDPNSALDKLEDATNRQADIETQLGILRQRLTEATGTDAEAIQRIIDDLSTGELRDTEREISALTDALQLLGYESAEQAEAELGRNSARIEAQRQLDQLFISGTKEQAEARREQNAREIEYIQGILPLWDELAKESDEAGDQLDAYTERLGNLIAEQEVLTDDTLSLIKARTDESEAVKAQISSLNERLSAEIEFAEVMATGSVDAIEDRIDSINRERSAIRALIPEFQALAKSSPEAQQELENLQNRLAGLGDEARRLGDEALPSALNREQLEGLSEIRTAEADTAKKILEIRSKALDDLETIEQKRADALDDITKTLDKTVAESFVAGNKEIAKTNAEYMKQSRKEWDDFYREQKESQVEYLKDLEKINEDWQLNSAEAEENNNLVAFIQARRRRDSELKEVSDTARDQADKRREEFEREQIERENELGQRIAQINAEGEAVREKAQQQFDERSAQIDEQATKELTAFRQGVDDRIKAEQTALTERIGTLRQQYRLEEGMIENASQKRQEALRQQEQAIVDQQSKINETVLDGVEEAGKNQLEQSKQIEQAKLNFQAQAMRQFADISNQAFSTIFENIQRGAQIALSAIQRSVNTSSSSSSSSSYRGTGTIMRFNNGGVIPRDQDIIRVNDGLQSDEREAIVKFKPSKGFQPSDVGMSGLPNVAVDLSGATFGGEITREDLILFAQTITGGVVDGLKGATKS